MGTFDEFMENLNEGAKGLAKTVFDGFEDEASEDIDAFLESTKDDMRRWTRLFSQGVITDQDLRDFVKASKALAEIHALKQKGVSLTQLEQFRSGLISMVVDTAFDVFL